MAQKKTKNQYNIEHVLARIRVRVRVSIQEGKKRRKLIPRTSQWVKRRPGEQTSEIYPLQRNKF